MKNIGIILPYISNSDNFVTKFLKKFKCEILSVNEYGFNFVVVYDNQNYNKMFNKNNVHDTVVLSDVECCGFNVLKGDKVYRRMLPEFVRKMLKSLGNDCSVTLVDRSLSDYGMDFAEKLCDMCSNIFIKTQNYKKAEVLCDRLLEKYGVIANVTDDKSPINMGLAVVIDSCGNDYGKNCIVIDKDSKKACNGVISDFYIPFRTKPPFGMSNLVFAECIETINCC